MFALMRLHRCCIVIFMTSISISILFFQPTVSSSLVLPPSKNTNPATRRWRPNIRDASCHTQILPPLHSNIAGNVRNETDDTPFHEFEEDDFAHAHPSMFNRQNRNQKRELSERDRNKLRALTSFDSETDDWDEYLDMSFDDIALDDSSETDSMHSDMNQSGAASEGKIEQSKDPILNGAAVASSTDFTSPRIQQKLHATNDGRADAFDANEVKKKQAERTSLRTPPEEDLKLEETSTNEVDVSEFRKKFQAKSAVEIEPLISEPQASLKSPRTRISSEQIEEIKTSISIVDAIESYNLPNFVRTNAHSAKACCPFHDDNNPSMSIDDNRGLYKCFACGAGGDLYNFIREYDALDGKKEKMGFMQAVQYAAKEFGDSRVADISYFFIQPMDWNDNMSNETKAKVIEKEKKKDRIRQANNAAAAFYTKSLVTLATAGKARAYLRSRKLSPDSIRTFAIGYAPDYYYGDEAKTKQTWGEGSLVNYLSNVGFSPNELVEAGLAVRTKSRSSTKRQSNEDEISVTDSEDYASLMDRFRNRLMVPILDNTGKHVIGFGGRDLESLKAADDTDSRYSPAKYINSPESAFVLFNDYNAKTAIEEQSDELKSFGANASNQTRGSHFSVIIVEGYFDAISLSNVGVKNAVASMGTALTVEQLKRAAEIVDRGQIIICMDNDDAGRNAVERLCSSNVIIKTPELSGTDILVATLPEGYKDPSDLVSVKESDAKSRFETEVLQRAEPWYEWYIRQIVQKYDIGSKDGTSFASLCEEVSNFLAVFPNAADRTRRVHNIVDILLDLISKDTDSQSSLGMMRVQLESDMLNIVSRKASARESIERRIEEKEGFGEDVAKKVGVLTSGEVAADVVGQRLSKSALKKLSVQSRQSQAAIIKQSATVRRPFQERPSPKTTYKTRKVQPQKRDLLPHFSGHIFKHKSDRDWLRLSGRPKPNMYLGSPGFDDNGLKLRAETSVFDTPNKRYKEKKDPVYFNSNQYIGERYLTQQAMEAGYSLGSSDKPSPGESLVDFTDRMLLERDADEMIAQAECRLLHALAKFSQARQIMRSVYSASTFYPPNMSWTSQERQWLFQCLTGASDPPISQELLESGTASQLRSEIAKLDGCPPNAFIPAEPPTVFSGDDGSQLNADSFTTDESGNQHHSEGKGSLETFFMNAMHMFPLFHKSEIAKETRAELTVQETVATLLRATAIKRFLSVKKRFTKIVLEMDRRADLDGGDQQVLSHEDFRSVSTEELDGLFKSVGQEVMEAQLSLYESDRSTDRVNAHLLDYSTSNSVQYRTSQAEIDRLHKMMEEHLESLPDDSQRPDEPDGDESYVYGTSIREQTSVFEQLNTTTSYN